MIYNDQPIVINFTSFVIALNYPIKNKHWLHVDGQKVKIEDVSISQVGELYARLEDGFMMHPNYWEVSFWFGHHLTVCPYLKGFTITNGHSPFSWKDLGRLQAECKRMIRSEFTGYFRCIPEFYKVPENKNPPEIGGFRL